MWHYACYFLQVQTTLELFGEPGLFLSNEPMEEVFCIFRLIQSHWWSSHTEMNTWIRMKNQHWSVDFSVLKCPPFVCPLSLSPPNNWTWKAHWFRNEEPLTLTHHMSKQTNSLTGGSCEPTVGSTAVVFEDNARSLCPTPPPIVTSSHAFALAQLNCQLLMATHTHTPLFVRTFVDIPHYPAP